MEEAADADYVVILDSGSIAAEGTPLALKNEYTGDFITLLRREAEAALTLWGSNTRDSARRIQRVRCKTPQKRQKLITEASRAFHRF